MSKLLLICALWFAAMAAFFAIACYASYETRWNEKFRRMKSLQWLKTGTRKEVFRTVTVFGMFLSASIYCVILAVRHVPDVLTLFSSFLIFMSFLTVASVNSHDRLDGVRSMFTKGAAPGILAGALAVYMWVEHYNWLVHVVCGSTVALMALASCRNMSTKLCSALCVGMVLYDVRSVFATKQMQQAFEGVTGTGAASSPFIGMLPIPSGLSLSSEPILWIGFGDILVPGLIILLAYRSYRAWGAMATIVCYIAGWIAALYFLVRFNHMQPATLYLIPATAIGAWIVSRAWPSASEQTFASR